MIEAHRKLYIHWKDCLDSHAQLRSALTKAECDLSNATTALGNAVAPDGRETSGVVVWIDEENYLEIKGSSQSYTIHQKTKKNRGR